MPSILATMECQSEVKNEAGLEGDASLQAALSYARIATSQGQIILC